jgi:hypothetical protein
VGVYDSTVTFYLHRSCLRGLAPPACTRLQLKSNVRKIEYVIRRCSSSKADSSAGLQTGCPGGVHAATRRPFPGTFPPGQRL